MNVNVEPKDKKYFDIIDNNNSNYRIFLRTSQNKTPSFSLCIVEEISPIKSISYKKTFLVEEFIQPNLYLIPLLIFGLNQF